MWLYFLCPLPIIFAILSYVFYVKGGKKEIMPLLIHLANKGYIRIEKIKKESIFSRSKDFKIVKLR